MSLCNDLSELYNQMKPQLRFAVMTGQIDFKEYDELWGMAKKEFWHRRIHGSNGLTICQAIYKKLAEEEANKNV